MRGIDWAGLLGRALAPRAAGGLGLRPCEFWALTPVELRLMLGEEITARPCRRAGLEALMARYPDDKGEGAE